jgi:O-acetyl-ADP-ribose deacetylase (regulator of RNase III)
MSTQVNDTSGYPFFHHAITPRLGRLEETGAAVIMHAVTITATFNNTIAQAILEAAGREEAEAIQHAVRRHTPIPSGHLVVTSAGALAHTRYLFHAVVSSEATRYAADPALIFQAVRRSVQLADLLGQPSLALPALGTGKGRASAVRVVKQMVNVILELLPGCQHLEEIIFATTDSRAFALFNNRVLADMALARREQELREAALYMPPTLYPLVGDLLQQLEGARRAGDHPRELLQQAHGLIQVAERLGDRLPPGGGPWVGVVQIILATGQSIIQNVNQQVRHGPD